ncbi:glycine cleavage system aminomethyltransferase GcvT [Bacillus sp. FJAT-50079]|uniref:glycine cleavage system aminomethyltransferase GcvT n=1 Tax=Bacillus sp. FJAT-50079 TaxID=2833577 RepID=UPI001BC9B3DA|nr:glycine cleavage system aminomethyltransferase GcvT [Bacillus sp. FJAT-50079]MBS4209618.1 glycine cleavage system aminomethyltransferase GcvT [Bacillus sp. FJAT-50079]
MINVNRTPLYSNFQKLGAKMGSFAGWELPIQFTSIKQEHEAVRTKAGLFDVSHMGEIAVTGKDSASFLQKMMTNDLSRLKAGSIQYTLMCNEKGGVLDDLLIYKRTETDYLLVVNAANTKKDIEWLRKHQRGAVEIDDRSWEYALLAIQGPSAEKIMQKLTSFNLKQIEHFTFSENVFVNDCITLVSRTGYTGENGFELYCHPHDAKKLWTDLLLAGKENGLLPCGLGARDTLRFEAGLSLYGQELAPHITPLEAGLSFAVKLNIQDDFIGKAALMEQKEIGVSKTIVGIEMIERGIPRHGYKVFNQNEEIGIVTSGTQSPTLKRNLGLALIDSIHKKIGNELYVDIRGKRLKAKVVQTPFYTRS